MLPLRDCTAVVVSQAKSEAPNGTMWYCNWNRTHTAAAPKVTPRGPRRLHDTAIWQSKPQLACYISGNFSSYSREDCISRNFSLICAMHPVLKAPLHQEHLKLWPFSCEVFGHN
eukprot:gnl/MRDRNA2_/MRDRNA2_14012_c0_seq1.p1 gnl/MRDRNA2_/MRDRNA2_14012_c0~~gnl/MRDRNA2_/MRDRNA2_14012_c0_seq1.p1  ORF type:complete len:114 (+),score=13.27 gnl/MRDRNA2_/MRDRNA2_14012_c0_seq1:91-432(+)